MPSRDASPPAKPAGSARVCDGNPGRVLLCTRHLPRPCLPRASRGLAKPSRDASLPASQRSVGSARVCDGNPGRVPKPSRDASLPAKPAGSARVCLARRGIPMVQLMNSAG